MDLIAGRLTYGLVSSTAAVNYMKDKSLRVLAMSGPGHFPQLSQVPKPTQLSFSGYDILGWYDLFAPVRTPASTTARIETDVLATPRSRTASRSWLSSRPDCRQPSSGPSCRKTQPSGIGSSSGSRSPWIESRRRGLVLRGFCGIVFVN